jgi:hypothetical protein
MKTKLNYTSLCLSLLLIFGFNIFGQITKPTPRPKPLIQPITVQLTKPKPLTQPTPALGNCFSNEEVKPDTKNLKPYYQGNDLSKIFNEIERRKKPVKDEFETTKEFLARVENEKKSPVIGNLNFTSTFTFPIKAEFKYDADEQDMAAIINFNDSISWNTFCYTDIYFSRKYKLTVKENKEFSYYSSASFKTDANSARKLKPNLQALLLTSIEGIADKYGSVLLEISPKEIWIYDISTGVVLTKEKARLPNTLDSAQAEILLAEAKALYVSGKDNEVMKILSRVIVIEPRSGEAYYLLGMIHLRHGDLDQAVSSFRTALFWENRLVGAHVALGKIYLQKGDCLQAKNYAASALAIDAENQDAVGLQRQVERCSK